MPEAGFPVTGSSPHTRGARLSCVVVAESLGIIPAYAGSTDSLSTEKFRARGSSPHTRGARPGNTNRSPRLWDHPRIRGEHQESPEFRFRDLGIIPAYAGST